MSQLGRVTSKHLFTNLLLEGKYDDEVAADLINTMKIMGPKMGKMMEAAKEEDGGFAMAMALRELMDFQFGHLNKTPYFSAKIDLCHQESFIVPPTDCNSSPVPVLVHRPKNLTGLSPAVVYVHGGGVIGGTAEHMKGHCSNIAVTCGVIIFNVDYRLAPEVKCPENIKDFYSALKYVLDNSLSLGVDPSRVAIMGESGGGYLTSGLCVMLAQKDESNLVKVAVPVIPMVDDYCFGDVNSMTKEEAGMAVGQRAIWAALATDLKEQRSRPDPLLFPAKSPDDLLEKFPPTLIVESEFDFYITEATRFARRLNSAGRLLDLVVIPGIGHAQGMEKPEMKKFQETMDIMKTIVKAYLID